MIKVSVLYPAGEGATFDVEYYVNQHLPRVAGLLGERLVGASVDRGVAGGAGGGPTYLAMAHLTFDSIEDFQQAMGPHREELGTDGPNYTNVQPIVQISEVVA